MNLKQMQVLVDSYQDRLIIRFTLNENELIDVMVTRRLLAEAWQNMISGLAQNVEQEELIPDAIPTGNVMSADEQMQFESKSTNYCYPMGREPLLVNEMEVEVQDDGRFVLLVREPHARQFAINLDSKGMTMLCVMLKAAAEAANWLLVLDFANDVAETRTEASVPVFSTPSRHLLH